MNKTKIKELVKEINYHIERAEILTKELNKLRNYTPLPFEGIQKLMIEDIIIKKEKRSAEDDFKDEMLLGSFENIWTEPELGYENEDE